MGQRLSMAFADGIERFSPSDFLELARLGGPSSLAVGLKLLQLAAWDPQWLCEMIPILTVGLSGASSLHRSELLSGLEAAEALLFSIGDSEHRSAIAEFRVLVEATSPT